MTISTTAWGQAEQQPEYPDPDQLAPVLERLQEESGLVDRKEVDLLREQMADVATGKRFALHGGACAESFTDGPEQMQQLMQVFLQVVVVLGSAMGLPIVKILRAAGQLAKPRSSLTQTRGGLILPSYFGDNVNQVGFTLEERTPDPERLLEGYAFSAKMWKLIRELATGGFADLAQVHRWNSDFVAASPQGQRYEQTAREIERFLGFLNFCGIDPLELPELHEASFFISHEGLILPYEEALTRRRTAGLVRYGLSSHFLWIGERTRQLDLAHVKYFASIPNNPIGVKLGPTATGEEAVELCKKLNPEHIPGRLTFIIRMGADKVRKNLPQLLRAVQAYEERIGRGPLVAWLCDPMHGNTFETLDGLKTRRLDVIIDEILGFFEVHRMVGTIPGGLSLEFTGENVTECVGGSHGLGVGDLAGGGYKSKCDPRLNNTQMLDLAYLLAEMLSDVR